VQAPTGASVGSLVGIAQVMRDAQGPPLAVGRMAVCSDKIDNGVTKGKAVNVLHTWKDYLWAMGCKVDPPEAVPLVAAGVDAAVDGNQEKDGGADGSSQSTDAPPPSGTVQQPVERLPVEAQGEPVEGPVAEEKLTPEGNVPNAHRTLLSSL
jgi:translation initiation factor 2D